jgi:hypothetical protein
LPGVTVAVAASLDVGSRTFGWSALRPEAVGLKGGLHLDLSVRFFDEGGGVASNEAERVWS